MKIITLGDSLTYGCWDEKGGWANRLRDYFQKRNLDEKVRLKRDWTWIFNLGISGITTTYLLDQLKKQNLAWMRFEHEPATILLQIGKNDSYLINKTDKNYVPKSIFRKNLIEIFNKISNPYIDITFLTLMFVDEDKLDPVPWVNEEYRSVSNKEIKDYNNIIKEVAQETHCDVIDLEKLWSQKDCSKFLDDDGLHPNSAGHKLIYEKANKYLQKKYNF